MNMRKNISILFLFFSLIAGAQTTPNLTKVLNAGNSGSSLQIKSIADPTAAQDAATKAYVDLGDNEVKPISEGGTNSTSSPSSGTVLRGNGTSWIPSTFTISNTFSANVIPYATSANTLGSSSTLTFDGTSFVLGSQTGAITIPFWIYKTHAGEQQLRVTNISTGTTSEAVIEADNNSSRIRLRKLSTGFTTSGMLAANDGVIENGAGNLVFKAATSTNILFGVTAGSSSTEYARFDTDGDLGIATSSPTEKLHVTGNVRFSGALMPNNDAGTATYNLVSQGAGLTPIWSPPATTIERANSLTGGVTGSIPYQLGVNTTDMSNLFYDNSTNGFGIGQTPTALLHIKAGTTTIAPIKLTSGTNLTTAQTGAFEYNGTNLFFTRTGTTRENVVTTGAVNAVSPTAPNRTITVVIDGTTYYIHAKTTND